MTVILYTFCKAGPGSAIKAAGSGILMRKTAITRSGSAKHECGSTALAVNVEPFHLNSAPVPASQDAGYGESLSKSQLGGGGRRTMVGAIELELEPSVFSSDSGFSILRYMQ